jgi:hypothetical protein
MRGFMTQSIIRGLGVGVLVLGLSASAFAQAGNLPPGPPEVVPPWVGIILDRLDDLEAKGGPCEVPPVWGKKIAGADRFVEVLDGGAYCDKETGLVWEQSPDPDLQSSWQSAITHCATLEVDDRKGWSLPVREQLASLVDETGTGVDSNGDPLTLPDGHPFDPAGVQSAFYWSATTTAGAPAFAWNVDFSDGFVRFLGNKGVGSVRAWCVRGGQVYDGQDVLNAVPAP